MQQVLEMALDRAEYIIESARQRPPKRKYLSSGRKSVFQKLYELYLEECDKEPEIKQKLRRNVNLLEKLVMQEALSCLVVNLYPGNEGYSLMLRGKNGSDSETIRLSYEEGELLEYLDNEELPPILVDLLEKSQINIFHCGCVITEIRDYRQSGSLKSATYQSRHVLLHPTMQTLVCDVHSITSDNHKWTQEDKLLLESQLILATAEPLCLDPSIAVTCTANRLLYNKQKMNTRPMKRCFKRHSRAALNRQHEVSHCPTPPQLRLLDYLQKRKERKGGQQYDLKVSKAGNCVDMWKQNPCHLAAPSEVDVEKYAKVEKSIKPDDSQPSVWPTHEIKDDYIFECEVGSQLQKTKLTVFQSLGNPLYYGKIQMLKGDEEGDSQASPSHFLIGSKSEADRVVSQYQELVQNEAKGPVKMCHNFGGSAHLCQLSPRKEIEPESMSPYIQSSMLGKGVKHRPPPIKLPSSTGSSSSGNMFSPQQSSGHLKSPTPPPPPPPPKPPGVSRKQSQDLTPLNLLSPAGLSPASSSQRASSNQVMTNPAGLNFVNVVGSACGAQTLMSGSSPMLGCGAGAISPTGINLSSVLPSGGLLPGALPATMPPSSQPAGGPFGFKSPSGLRPLNLLQASEQGCANPDQALCAQQTATINLTGVGNFMPPQSAAAIASLGAPNGYSGGSSGSAAASSFRQPLKK
ncbi:transcription factor SPT20 homolog isoform X4 [Paroedura picta]|uniref:transcription factor SPT20 homolog isoform X4 n=1 Tax=Paroedura picta TaxID=143630 RepID=UPI004057542D